MKRPVAEHCTGLDFRKESFGPAGPSVFRNAWSTRSFNYVMKWNTCIVSGYGDKLKKTVSWLNHRRAVRDDKSAIWRIWSIKTYDKCL